MNLRQKFFQFMYGRYGVDKLTYTLMFVYLTLVIVNVFLHNPIITIAGLLLFVYIIFRMFSRQTYKRSNENQKFMRTINKLTCYFKFNFTRLKHIRKKVYCKCPNCKAVIRLPRKRGRHIVSCPKCHTDFPLKVRF